MLVVNVRDVVFPGEQIHVVAVANDGPDRGEIAVVLQAAPNGWEAPGSLPGSRPDGRHGFIKLGTQGWVRDARSDDDGVVSIAKFEVVNQRIAELRTDLAHDAL